VRLGATTFLIFTLGVVNFGNADVDIRHDPIVEAVAKVKPSVVNISTAQIVEVHDPFEDFFGEFFGHNRGRPVEKRQMPYSLGSGVIVDEDGYILTNTHVVERADVIGVLLGNDASDTNNVYQAKVVERSEASDIALLKIDPKHGEKFQAVRFAKDDDLLLGETVIALGNPYGLGLSVSRGILSSTTRRPQPDQRGPLAYQDWLQTDAAVNPGNSGGPLIDLRGELIGINNAVFRKDNAQGISFAIPIKRIGETLSEIFTPENKGFWFGARIKSDQGRLSVMKIETGSPAEKAGLKTGDLILKIADKPPKNFIEFMVELIKASENRDVTLTVSQRGEQKNVPIRIVREDTVFKADLIREKLGLSVQIVTPEMAQNLQFQPDSGLVITGVDRNSPGAEAGLQPGILLTGIDDDAVNTVVAAAKKLYGKRKGDKVSLSLLAWQQRGRFLYPTPGRVELKVRQ
jgi:serine protease Do